MSESKAVPDVCGPVHGQGGVYSGGDWVPIEECASLLQDPSGRGGKCGNCATCPKRRPGADESKSGGASDSIEGDDGIYDVVVIGAGCVGGGVCRELSKYNLRVLLLEKADDVTQGATKGNSGIVHAGYDDKPGSVRAKFCWAGNRKFAQLDKELNFGFIRNGSLVVARTEAQMPILHELMERADANGVENCRIVGREELLAMEPNVHPDSIAALYSPDAGTVTPYEFTIALVENAVQNGVRLRLNTEVVGIEGKAGDFRITTRSTRLPREGSVGFVKEYVKAVNPGRRGFQPWHAPVAAAAVALAGVAMRSEAELPALVGMFAAAALALVVVLFTALSGGSGKGVNAAAPKGKGQGEVTGEIEGQVVSQKGMPEFPNFAVQLAAQRADALGVLQKGAPPQASTRVVRARYIVNAAGLFSDTIARMVGDESFTIKPRLGEYLLLHKDQGKLIKHVIFPAPGPMGKGVVVQPTLWGNLLLGPTARELHDPATAQATKEELMRLLISKCKDTFPYFDAGDVIHSFTGARAKNSRGDWIVETCATCSGMVHAAGIDSPGLAGSPAVAAEVCRLLGTVGLDMEANPEFNPYRAPIIRPKNGWRGLSLKKQDPKAKVICKCELVTEAEIVDAIRRPTPCDSTQAVRKRTRAGMGHCQGNYCESRVKSIIARELGISAEEVRTRPWPESSLLPDRWISDDYKEHLRGMAGSL